MNKTEVKFERVFVSPEKAKVLLKNNKTNRKVNRNQVNRYVAQMKKGQWQEDTAEPIKIAVNGRLLDGQHRLSAVVLANQGFFFHIASNISEATFPVLDTGKKRSPSDALDISGVKNSTPTAGGISVYLSLKKGKVTDGRKREAATNDDVVNEYNNRPNFWNNVVSRSLTYYTTFNRTMSPSLIIGWYALFNDISSDKAEDFMHKLCTGVGLTTTSNPIVQLKAILEKSKTTYGRKLNDYDRTALIIKAWNDYLSGTNRMLKFDAKESYPKLSMKPLVNITNDDALATV